MSERGDEYKLWPDRFLGPEDEEQFTISDPGRFNSVKFKIERKMDQVWRRKAVREFRERNKAERHPGPDVHKMR